MKDQLTSNNLKLNTYNLQLCMLYQQITIQTSDIEARAILSAQLDAMGAEGFEETEDALIVYFKEDNYREAELQELLTTTGVSFQSDRLEETNWNAVWESNFEPVYVEDFLCIRADFHPAATGVEHELIITPKMSFGTGHHATTWLMARAMRSLSFLNKRVLDFGTGTGVLAILAEKLGADYVWAIDNDEWSIRNSEENLQRNQCNRIELGLVDHISTDGERFDIILANINKHVILENMHALSAQLQAGGLLLLSGLLSTDEQDIRLAASVAGLEVLALAEKDNWLCIRLGHSATQ
jgi:ribosomal protein L11 methyltransferase